MARVSEALYPFESQQLTLEGGLQLHYLDEGPKDAEPLVMVHGNPSWSFYYRRLVMAMRERYRCIAIDHIGCGLSDKPGDEAYDYSLARRVADLDALIAKLGLGDNITLVLHDWGGMIGMAWAVKNQARVKRLVLLNTAAFHLPSVKRLPLSLKLARSGLGAVLVRGFNAFAKGAVRYCVTRAPMSAEVAAGYLAPYDSWANRIAVHRFVQDIPIAPGDKGFEIVSEVEQRLSEMEGTPKLIVWGRQDFVFDDAFLDEWKRRCPEAEYLILDDAGHYVLEDAPDAVGARIASFLEAHPLEDAG